ncbi:GNAT family N-acetyltransferase [Undibacterium sp. Jales W-56]|uniref:GNAT family N-acetyltransferase n=1 Tax=Undibacterium sp. Jales W-56 TaxID=2897325 RepID=UPI0021D1A4CA|nr:GNAT family N-acetyltransferase [Undibacterium sp. Jales W-56]MCU6434296.1 GNAT family N-acetyltransferase [Undibacterium sp. Jales W-56]
MSISIRRAKTGDCNTLTELMHASAAYQGSYSAILDGYTVSPEQITSDNVYIAEEGETVLGFYSLVITPNQAELDLMFVRDEAQGRGVGAHLFDHMRTLATSFKVGAVKIVSHPPAKNFYLGLGARVIGTQAPSAKVAWPRSILSLEL